MKAAGLTGAIITCGTLLLASGARADIQSVTYEGQFPDLFLSSFFLSDDFPFDTAEETITGLPRFDPALGTLVDATLDFELEYSVELYIESQGILNPGVPHFASLTFDQVAAGVIYTRNDGTILGLIDLQIGSVGAGCQGNPGDGDACFGFGSYFGSIGTSGYSFINEFAPEDITGAGELTVFTANFDLIGGVFDLNNVDFATLDASMYVDFASVSVTYYYDTGGDPDSDGDGVSDALDSCINVANPGQLDSDGDGYGNACDSDVNNDCIVNTLDLGLLRVGFFGTNPDLDFNGDGSVNTQDLGILKQNFFAPPGPSGLTSACQN